MIDTETLIHEFDDDGIYTKSVKPDINPEATKRSGRTVYFVYENQTFLKPIKVNPNKYEVSVFDGTKWYITKDYRRTHKIVMPSMIVQDITRLGRPENVALVTNEFAKEIQNNPNKYGYDTTTNTVYKLIETNQIENRRIEKQSENSKEIRKAFSNSYFTIPIIVDDEIEYFSFVYDDDTRSTLTQKLSTVDNAIGYVVDWIDENGVLFKLTKSDLLKISFIFEKYLNAMWGQWGIYDNQIQDATSLEELDSLVFDYDIEIDYDETPEEKAQRIAQLFLTKADVLIALYKDKGITPDNIKSMLSDNTEALIRFDYASNYYRGDSVVVSLGAALGYTSDELDYLFEHKHFPIKDSE